MINLIGINGYIGSGKDTVGRIIQEQCTYPDPHKKYTGQDWEIRKFAGKLKQIASILTGIPVEKFEDQEFKKAFLGPEWEYKYRIPRVSLEQENIYYEDRKMTIREFLQKLGTEAIRDGLHINAWINAAFSEYVPVHEISMRTSWIAGDTLVYPRWIFTDCRFPNEAQAIKNRGGIVIRVNRPELPVFDPIGDVPIPIVKKHPSETSLDNWSFDWVIDNNGTMEDLILKVKIMLEQFEILTPEVINN
jgi:hypothetical protein